MVMNFGALVSGSETPHTSEEPNFGDDDIFPMNGSCANCYQSPKKSFFKCTSCKLTRYCSKECQKADWKLHKKSKAHCKSG